jgi:hypothetical protein
MIVEIKPSKATSVFNPLPSCNLTQLQVQFSRATHGASVCYKSAVAVPNSEVQLSVWGLRLSGKDESIAIDLAGGEKGVEPRVQLLATECSGS